jgi:hypothetical protein
LRYVSAIRVGWDWGSWEGWGASFLGGEVREGGGGEG